MNRSLRLMLLGALGLSLLGTASLSFGQIKDSEVYGALNNGTIWVHPSAKDKVNLAMVEEAANNVKPYNLKVLVIPQLSGKWVRNGKENRIAFAESIVGSKVKADKPLMIVFTTKGISGYAPGIPDAQLIDASNQAAKLFSRNDFTPAIVNLAERISTLKVGQVAAPTRSDVRASAPIATERSSGSLIGGFVCLAVPIAIVAGIIALAVAAKNKRLKVLRREVTTMKDQVVDGLSYLDSYDGFLTSSVDAEALRQYRNRAAENFDKGVALLNSAQMEQQLQQARYSFQLAAQDIRAAQTHIEASTGGSGTAYRIPPLVDETKAPIWEPVSGVSFFSGEPSDRLQPVEININGQRRTVMANPTEIQAIQSGQMPQMRGLNDGGRFTPWYDVNGYDPRRGGFDSGFIWNMMAASAVMNMITPHHYGPPVIINNPAPSFDPNYGSNFGNSGEFGAGDFGGSDFGGTDFGGGGDFGGDFGEGDFGGWDGGGGDFGGGDFGGGDFGGD